MVAYLSTNVGFKVVSHDFFQRISSLVKLK